MENNEQPNNTAVDIDSIALDAATKIMPLVVGAFECQTKAQVQETVRDALDQYTEGLNLMLDQRRDEIAALRAQLDKQDTTTWPCRTVRFTFTHPTLGDDLFVPLVDDAMRSLVDAAEEQPCRTPIQMGNGVTVLIEPLEMTLTPEQEAMANAYKDVSLTGTGMVSTTFGPDGQVITKRIDPFSISHHIGAGDVIPAATECTGPVIDFGAIRRAAEKMELARSAVDCEIDYTGPERRSAPTEDPAATDPQCQFTGKHIPGAGFVFTAGTINAGNITSDIFVIGQGEYQVRIGSDGFEYRGVKIEDAGAAYRALMDATQNPAVPETFEIDTLTQQRIEKDGEEYLRFDTTTATRDEVIEAGIQALSEHNGPAGASIRYRANLLVADAERSGQVLTIELKPKQPLAMGNYRMVADVRPARQPN
jgi:RNA binding exosome subunit